MNSRLEEGPDINKKRLLERAAVVRQELRNRNDPIKLG